MTLTLPTGCRVWPDCGWWRAYVPGCDLRAMRFGSEVQAIRACERFVAECEGTRRVKGRFVR